MKDFYIKNTGNAVDLRFESETEDRKIASSSSVSAKRRLLFEEILETDFEAWVYHPNFAKFAIALENGLKQTRERFQSGSTGRLKNSYLNRFHILSTFLRQKPYSFSLLADKSRQIENREFFERQIVDSTRYAGNFGFRNSFIPVGFYFNNSTRVIDRASFPEETFKDNQIGLTLSNHSQDYGETNFSASRNKFSRTETGIPNQEGQALDLNVTNQNLLYGPDQDNNSALNSNLNFYELTGTNKSSILNWNENLNIEHTRHLSSAYNFNFQDRSSQDARVKDAKLSANLRHKLYESLISTFGPYYFRSDASTFTKDAYGFSFDEDYVKKLGKIGRLSLGLGLNYSEEIRKAPQNIISIIDEPHTLRLGEPAFLDNPRVNITTVRVSTADGVERIVDTDFKLVSAGERTRIEIIPFTQGGHITDGATVLVDYQAGASPFFKFNTIGQDYFFRMDFLDDLIGVYYNLIKEGHPRTSGEEGTILQTLTDTVMGVDFNYKNLEIEIEDQDYDSNLSAFKQVRLRESFSFNPTYRSTLTLQSSQTKIRFLNTQDTQRFLEFITRYALALTRYTRFTIEGGFRRQKGAGVNLDDVTASGALEINVGKFLMDARYDFIRQLNLGDRLANHFFSTRIKRKF